MNPIPFSPLKRTPAQRLFRRLARAPLQAVEMLHSQPQGVLMILLVWLAALCAGAITYSMDDIFTELAQGKSPAAFSWGVLLVASVLSWIIGLGIWVLRHSLGSLREASFVSVADPRDVLTLFISPQALLTEVPALEGALTVREVSVPRQNALDDAQRLSELRWNWEMLLRAIYPHHATARRVYLIGSAPGANPGKDPGSHRQLSICSAFLQPYLPGSDIIEWPEARDFEEVGQMHELIEAILDHDEALHHSDDSRICIDVTGGQKPASIAGTLATLNRRVTIQYVSTINKEVHRYDLHCGTPQG